MGKWIAGRANKWTISRLFIMPVVILLMIGWGWTDPAWYWVGALFLAFGMAADYIDGMIARIDGPTPEGQFLDQFMDKVFLYPILAAYCVRTFGEFGPHFYLGVAVMFGMDAKSCLEHYRSYRFSVGLNPKGLIPSFGAVPYGKYKFWAQNFLSCCLLASRCPANGADGAIESVSRGVVAIATFIPPLPSSWPQLTFAPWPYLFLTSALLLAVLSLRQRSGVRERVVEQLEQQPI